MITQLQLINIIIILKMAVNSHITEQRDSTC